MPFDWISEDGGGARFPPSVRAIPLVQHDGKGYGLIDWKLVQDGRGVGKETLDQSRKVVVATIREPTPIAPLPPVRIFTASSATPPYSWKSSNRTIQFLI